MLDDLVPRAPDDPTWRRSFVTIEHTVRAQPGRAVAVAAALLAVALGVWWFFRTPSAPPPETLLPFVSTTAPDAATPGATAGVPGGVDDVPVTIVVHVAGAVVRPGVLRLPEGARVVDAVTAAGGATADADTDRINLAAAVVDGAWIHVPRFGEQIVSPPSGATHGSPTEGASPAPVDLNTATPDQLEALPGIGPATSAAIIEHRTRNGPFATVEALGDVAGIGPAKLAQLLPLVRV